MPVDRQQLQRGLRRLVSGQNGYFTAAQALEVGYTYQAQKYHVDRGNWARIDRALFRIADWPTSADDIFVRWTVWAGGGVVVSHDSALEVHDLGDVNPSHLHLTASRAIRRQEPGVMWHIAPLSFDEVENRGGFSVTRPARALVEFAAQRSSQELLDGAIAEAVARGLVTPRSLRDAAVALGPLAELGIERGLSATSPRG